MYNNEYIGWNLENDLSSFLDVKNIYDIKSVKRKCVEFYQQPLNDKIKELNKIRIEILSLKSQKEMIEKNINLENSNIDELANELEQINKTLNELLNNEKRLEIYIENTKKNLAPEISSINNNNDLNVALKTYINRKQMMLSSRNINKLSNEDINKFCNFVRGLPSITGFINNNNKILSKVDSQNHIVKYDRTIPKNENNDRDKHCITLKLKHKPDFFPGIYGEKFSEDGILAIRFAKIGYSSLKHNDGKFTQNLNEKLVVGIIKKNQLGDVKKYIVLMNDIYTDFAPSFYSKIMFSDLLLENSKNNFGFLGIPVEDKNSPKDDSKKFKNAKVVFDDIGMDSLLTAVYLEDNKDLVEFKSNSDKIRSFKDYISSINEKLDLIINKVVSKNNTNENKSENEDNEELSI